MSVYLCAHPLRCFHLFEEIKPHLLNEKVVSPYPIFFACAFKVLELLCIPLGKGHKVFSSLLNVRSNILLVRNSPRCTSLCV